MLLARSARWLRWQSTAQQTIPQFLRSLLCLSDTFTFFLYVQAPVPFVLGVQYKTAEVASKSSSLTRVNVYKDKISLSQALPALPNYTALEQVRGCGVVWGGVGWAGRGGAGWGSNSRARKEASWCIRCCWVVQLPALPNYIKQH